MTSGGRYLSTSPKQPNRLRSAAADSRLSAPRSRSRGRGGGETGGCGQRIDCWDAAPDLSPFGTAGRSRVARRTAGSAEGGSRCEGALRGPREPEAAGGYARKRPPCPRLLPDSRRDLVDKESRPDPEGRNRTLRAGWHGGSPGTMWKPDHRVGLRGLGTGHGASGGGVRLGRHPGRIRTGDPDVASAAGGELAESPLGGLGYAPCAASERIGRRPIAGRHGLRE
jgi:hypothetical protein